MITRREFTAALAGSAAAAKEFPLVDYHVHLDEQITLEKALEISQRRGVRFGIVEHAGKPELGYRGMLSTDGDLRGWLDKLAGKPVYRGIQAEGLDWIECFSPALVAELDYVLQDALTVPQRVFCGTGGDEPLIKLWTPAARTIEDPEGFMDRYVDFHVELMRRAPIDILANPTFLPPAIAKDHVVLWTQERMEKIIEAALRYGVAIEINSRYRLPTETFLRIARKAGVKFSFGSNIHGPDVGRLDYCVEMARQLGLTHRDLFAPAPAGQKPVERRARA
jgi:histidinol phosphatase-like PHP family hydrolase